MKGWAETWSSFPAAHKKRCYQGLSGYVLLALLTGTWISFKSHDTIKEWQGHIPSATAEVKNVYLTPQIAAAAPDEEPKETPVAAAPAYDDGKIYVSVIVSGLGLSSHATQRAVDDLPAQMTLAFSPYANNVKEWIKKALAEKHETLLLLPMEAMAYPQNDPGPRALSSRLSDQNNNENLNWVLTQGEGSTGVMNYMGTRFMTDEKRLVNAFNTLRKNSALFIETPGMDRSAAAAAASKTGLPYMEAKIEIDAVATDNAIRAQLDALELAARKNGYAIGIAQPYPLTMNILKSWAEGLAERGIILAPLRTVWKNKPHYEDTSAPPQEQLRQP